METLEIHKLGWKQLTAQNALDKWYYSKRIAISNETKLMNHKCLHMKDRRSPLNGLDRKRRSSWEGSNRLRGLVHSWTRRLLAGRPRPPLSLYICIYTKKELYMDLGAGAALLDEVPRLAGLINVQLKNNIYIYIHVYILIQIKKKLKAYLYM